MNIVYDINPETGLMRLKFKDGLLNSLLDDNREAFDKYLLPLLAMNDKFVLTGSLSLKLLGFEPLDRVGDFDIGLTSAFTEEDFNTAKNFFGFFINCNVRRLTFQEYITRFFVFCFAYPNFCKENLVRNRSWS